MREKNARTHRTDPAHYSPIVSGSRAESFRYALSGWAYMLRYQKNTRIQAAATLLVIAFGLWLGLAPLEWAVVALVIGLVWLTEFINAAIEAAVNVISPDLHPMAKVSKDVAAGATLFAVILSVIVGLLVLGPPLVEKLAPGS